MKGRKKLLSEISFFILVITFLTCSLNNGSIGSGSSGQQTGVTSSKTSSSGNSSSQNSSILNVTLALDIRVDIYTSFTKDPKMSNKYTALATIRKTDTTIEKDEYNSSIITVNDKRLNLLVSRMPYFIYSGNELLLNIGDTVNIKISHPNFGTIESSLIVPESVSIIYTDPSDINLFQKGIVNSITSNWNNVTCTNYMAWIIFDYLSGPYIVKSGYGRWIDNSNTSYVFGSNYLSGIPSSATISFEVYPYNSMTIINNLGKQFYRVQCPVSPNISNKSLSLDSAIQMPNSYEKNFNGNDVNIKTFHSDSPEENIYFNDLGE